MAVPTYDGRVPDSPPDATDVSPYDALLLVSFGGPEGPEDVMPFLENVTRGRDIPRERLAAVGEHYFLFGGRSPINDQNRAFVHALRKDLADAGIDVPVYWGNRNWDPYLADTFRQMTADGVRRVACFVTAPTRRSPVAGNTARTSRQPSTAWPARRSSTSCGTTSTIQVSSSRWSTRLWPRSSRCPRSARADGSSGLRDPLDPDPDE